MDKEFLLEDFEYFKHQADCWLKFCNDLIKYESPFTWCGTGRDRTVATIQASLDQMNAFIRIINHKIVNQKIFKIKNYGTKILYQKTKLKLIHCKKRLKILLKKLIGPTSVKDFLASFGYYKYKK